MEHLAPHGPWDGFVAGQDLVPVIWDQGLNRIWVSEQRFASCFPGLLLGVNDFYNPRGWRIDRVIEQSIRSLRTEVRSRSVKNAWAVVLRNLQLPPHGGNFRAHLHDQLRNSLEADLHFPHPDRDDRHGDFNRTLPFFRSLAEISRYTNSRKIADVLVSFLTEHLEHIVATDHRFLPDWFRAIQRSAATDEQLIHCMQEIDVVLHPIEDGPFDARLAEKWEWFYDLRDRTLAGGRRRVPDDDLWGPDLRLIRHGNNERHRGGDRLILQRDHRPRRRYSRSPRRALPGAAVDRELESIQGDLQRVMQFTGRIADKIDRARDVNDDAMAWEDRMRRPALLEFDRGPDPFMPRFERQRLELY